MHAYRSWPFLSDPHHHVLSAVWAVAVHGVLSLLVVAPLLWRSRHSVTFAACAFTGGFALDLDHAVVAGSLSPNAMEHLAGRPDTHSLLFAVALAFAAFALT